MELKALQTDRKRIVQLPVNSSDGEVELIGLAIWHHPVTPLLDDRLAEIAGEFQFVVYRGGNIAENYRRVMSLDEAQAELESLAAKYGWPPMMMDEPYLHRPARLAGQDQVGGVNTGERCKPPRP